MSHHFISKYNENYINGYGSNSSGGGGMLTYCYRWKIPNWSDVKPFMEYTSRPFSADGLQWCVRSRIFSIFFFHFCIHNINDFYLQLVKGLQGNQQIEAQYDTKNIK